jgi:predicted CXXCH cytochrome family protein
MKLVIQNLKSDIRFRLRLGHSKFAVPLAVRILTLAIAFLLTPGLGRANSVVNSVHNLSATGPGTVKAVSETDTCIFCHTVHKTTGDTPLWNHTMSLVTNYTVYSSPTMKAVVGQPDGSSRLCLSCHDGTVALGMVNNRTTTIQMQGGVTTMPSGSANLGTDLSGDHPISFVYDQNLSQQDPRVKDPATLDKKIRLDHFHKLQCVSCHNPHDDQFGKFLVMDNTGSALCLACHTDSGWSGSAHNLSTASLVGPAAKLAQGKRVTTVAANACENCHTSHRAGSKAQLLVQAKEEENCFSCHNGTVVKKNLTAEFSKPSAHPLLQSSSLHKLNEDPINSSRHTSCADCHNSHAAVNKTAVVPNSPGSIAGVIGVNAAGAIVKPAGREYELCFRCHADSMGRGPTPVPRQWPQTNKRIQFAPSNQSFHPIESAGRNPIVPSLIAPWTAASLMYCTDCHNNDQGPRAGGTGPDGPHGSAFAPLLERQLLVTDFNPESASTYALCYKCHSRTSILANQSFKYHSKHIVDDKSACTTCHDSHGVASSPNLINFNRDYVTPSANGRLEYTTSGKLSGNCTLTCHGKDHQNVSYSPSDIPGAQPAKLKRR